MGCVVQPMKEEAHRERWARRVQPAVRLGFMVQAASGGAAAS